jgi:hypothetical protein
VGLVARLLLVPMNWGDNAHLMLHNCYCCSVHMILIRHFNGQVRPRAFALGGAARAHVTQKYFAQLQKPEGKAAKLTLAIAFD